MPRRNRTRRRNAWPDPAPPPEMPPSFEELARRLVEAGLRSPQILDRPHAYRKEDR